jgi:hypothetical protein
MIHRSSSSRRRKNPRHSPNRSTGSLVRKTSVAFDLGSSAADEKGFKRDRRSGSDAEASSTRIRDLGRSAGTITVTAAADEHGVPPFASYPPERVSSDMLDNAISLNEYPQKSRGSIGESSNRPSRNSVTSDDAYSSRNLGGGSDSMGRKTRSSLLPLSSEASKSPRNSLVPEDAYNRSPRGSIDPSVFNRGSRSSLCPDPDQYNRSARPSMVADVTALRNSRNSLLPDTTSPNRSPRNSLVPGECTRSPRGSLVPDVNRSPRNSLVPDGNRTPRGSLVADVSRTPRGSVTSESSVYSYNRSSRSSLPLQDGSSIFGKSPRGSIASATGVQFDMSVKTPRGSIESVPPGRLHH